VIHDERPIFLEVTVSVIVANLSHEHVFFDLSSSITQYVNGQALHFKTKITLVVIKMANKLFEEVVTLTMFKKG
jgi:hypothetical protein